MREGQREFNCQTKIAIIMNDFSLSQTPFSKLKGEAPHIIPNLDGNAKTHTQVCQTWIFALLRNNVSSYRDPAFSFKHRRKKEVSDFGCFMK